jgi:uncharacterized protein YgbK (DUF1537 family)
MLLGVIADDFTGAGDIANTLAKGLPGQGGMAVTQYLGIPDGAADDGVEAGVISLKTRSVLASDAVAQSLAALDWLRAQGCTQIVFKYCSTFDSTPEGNIGPVGEALAKTLDAKGVIVCPAFPTLGRTVHQGHLFVNDRLLSESSMRHHPLTPMSDPDIRRWLGRQTTTPVGLVTTSSVRSGPEAARRALEASAARGEILTICDAATDEDLQTLGIAAADAPLITGGSGIAIGLPANFIKRGLIKGNHTTFNGVEGGEVILAGSCSTATRRQIETHSKDHPTLALDIDAIMAGQFGIKDIVPFVEMNLGHAPLVFSSDDPVEVARYQEKYGKDELADTLDALFADTASTLKSRGVRRIVVAGGETSGAVAKALDIGALMIGPEIDTGVPILVGPEGGIALALKSGNFGGPDFFMKALEALRTGKPA